MMRRFYEGKLLLVVGFFLVAAAFFVINAPRAEAAGLSFTASTTASITGSGETWTIAGGSNASSVQIGTSNMVVSLQNTDIFTVSVTSRSFSATGQSSDSILTNTLCYTNFGDGIGKIVITATGNETVTLSTVACGLFTPSGHAAVIPPTLPTYGGQKLIFPTPTPTPTPTPPAPPLSVLPTAPTIADIQLAINEVLQKIVELRANPNVPFVLSQLQQLVERVAKIQQAVTGGVQPATGSTGSITQGLGVGSGGSQVTALQNFLISQGVYPEARVTGYFGPLTREAVERLQEKYGIANEGDAGYGFVGPKTRAKINSLLGL